MKILSGKEKSLLPAFFSLFPQCFQRAFPFNLELCNNMVVQCDIDHYFLKMDQLTLSKQALVLTCLQYKSFENTAGKGENAHNEQFLLFHSVLYPSGELSATFIRFKIVICKPFQFGSV